MVRSQIPPMISDAPKTQLEVKHFCTRFCWLEQLNGAIMWSSR